MTNPLVLEHPDAVRIAMRVMDAATRTRGEAYFSEGRVERLAVGETPGEYFADVRGSQAYQVRI